MPTHGLTTGRLERVGIGVAPAPPAAPGSSTPAAPARGCRGQRRAAPCRAGRPLRPRRTISALASELKLATDGVLASLIACWGCRVLEVAVGHDREVVDHTVHPLGGTQLGKGLGVVAGGVGRLAHRLADDRGWGGTQPGGQGVTVGELGVLVDEGFRPRPGASATPARASRAGPSAGRRTPRSRLDAGDVLGQVPVPVVRRLVPPCGFLLLRTVPVPRLLGASRTPLPPAGPRPADLPRVSRIGSRRRGSHHESRCRRPPRESLCDPPRNSGWRRHCSDEPASSATGPSLVTVAVLDQVLGHSRTSFSRLRRPRSGRRSRPPAPEMAQGLQITGGPCQMFVRRRPTLPRPLGFRAVGAERLRLPVRYGTGCFSRFAIAA